jgi:hypothetical protein
MRDMVTGVRSAFVLPAKVIVHEVECDSREYDLNLSQNSGPPLQTIRVNGDEVARMGFSKRLDGTSNASELADLRFDSERCHAGVPEGGSRLSTVDSALSSLGFTRCCPAWFGCGAGNRSVRAC